MAHIQKLPQNLINKIAAGEVIERPASVVKELVENGLDAHATQITLEVEEGGIRLIRIFDNGDGMEPEDLALALEPHATSKISTEKDLFSILSLGFRGEALASIGAISEMLISSKTAQGEGFQITNDHPDPKPCAMTKGTLIEVRDLFSRTPGRRKFLKAPSAEFRQIQERVIRLALSHPKVGFVVKHNQKEILRMEATKDFRERVRYLFDRELARDLIPVNLEGEGYKISGFVAPPKHSKKDTTGQYTFLNGRYIKDKLLISAIRNAMGDVFMKGRHPILFLFLEVPPSLVDVNVHPRKLEVRFVEERKIYKLIYSGLREKLDGPAMIPAITLSPPSSPLSTQQKLPLSPSFSRPPSQRSGSSKAPKSFSHSQASENKPQSSFATPSWQKFPAPAPSSVDPDLAEIEQVFQVHASYLVAQVPEGLRIIDQHALHEKILYVQLSESFQSRVIETQSLLIPEEIELSLEERALFEEFSSTVHKLGFDFMMEEPKTLKILGYPLYFEQANWRQFFLDLLSDLSERKSDRDIAQEQVIASMACRGAIKQGKRLSQQEIHSLIQQALPLAHTYTCAHGRPTSLFLSLRELETMFKRK